MKSRLRERLQRFKKLDPRMKIFSAFTCICFLLVSKDFFFPAVIFVFFLICLFILVQRPETVLNQLREPIFVIMVLIFIKSLSGKEEIFSMTFPFLKMSFTFYSDGFIEGMTIAARAMASVAVVFFFKEMTSFFEFLSALSWYKVPREIVEILIFADRFIFQLTEKATKIYISQRNRLGYSGVKKGFISFGILFGTLFMRILEQSEKVALSMSLRGYDGKLPLESLGKLSKRDIIFTAVFILIIVWFYKL
ncbi:MAG: cobalt ECF transporter T component CbiQ [Deltaproteobacteria bacterium]|nr:cobalt ECF transporter T component CbiQ [Deltaproteobacteria bacterium]